MSRTLPLQPDILAAAIAGALECHWVRLAAVPGVEVSSDALKLDGHRVQVTAETAQRVADLYGARLTTPLLDDLIHEQAGVRVYPATVDHARLQDPGECLNWSRDLDQKIGAVAPGTLVSSVGKNWVLTRALQTKPLGTACNYGMYTTAALAPLGTPGAKPSVTGRFRVLQQPGYRHNDIHWDYSQTLRLCRGPVPSDDGTTLARQPSVPAPAAGAPLVPPPNQTISLPPIIINAPLPPAAKSASLGVGLAGLLWGLL